LKNCTIEAEADDGGRSATGALISEPRARDIKINAFSLALQGKVLVEDTIIELNQGGRYGLLGRNGCGKSTLLKCLAAREIPIPAHFDVYLLDHEAGMLFKEDSVFKSHCK
jgi:ATP-binding cassette, subfamily F, member 2